MIDNKTVYALIPARGGSKGIKFKAIAALNSRPMLAYTAEAACNSVYIDKAVVSTDYDEIMKVARQYNLEVPFRRPAEISGDEASTSDCILHFLNYCAAQNKFPDIIVVLQPTSPLRTAEDIDRALEAYIKFNANALVSVTKTPTSPYWFKKQDACGQLSDFIAPPKNSIRRQDTQELVLLNGAIYIYDANEFLRDPVNINKKTYSYLMTPEKSIDVDTMLDLKIAEFLLKRGVI
jgi:CMP-N,N'-diacetyllegionaminic acid synthase